MKDLESKLKTNFDTTTLSKFEDSSTKLDEMLKIQKSSKDKGGIGSSSYSNYMPTSHLTPIKFVKEKGEEKIQEPHGRPTVSTVHRPSAHWNFPKVQNCNIVSSSSTCMPKVASNELIRKFYTPTTRHGLGFKKPKSNTIQKSTHSHKPINSMNTWYHKGFKITQRWIRVGVFDANHPGPMKHWVPKA